MTSNINHRTSNPLRQDRGASSTRQTPVRDAVTHEPCRWCGQRTVRGAFGCDDCFWSLPADIRYRITLSSARGMIDPIAAREAGRFFNEQQLRRIILLSNNVTAG